VHISPLEVLLKHLSQIIPIVDLLRWEVLEPRSSGFR
jgi:hypothetical protein